MGVNTDAILAYGVTFEEYELPFIGLDEDEDVEDPGDLAAWLAQQAGLTNPWDEVPDEVNEGPYAGFQEWEAANPEWRTRERAYSKTKQRLEDEAPVEIFSHCSDDAPMYGIALKGMVTAAARGYPERVSCPTPDPNDMQTAIAFCKRHKLKPFDRAGWLLCSYWS